MRFEISDELGAAGQLMLDQVEVAGAVWLPEAGAGAMVAQLAGRCGRLVVSDRDARAQVRLQALQAAMLEVTDSPLPALAGAMDQVLLVLPPSRPWVRRLLLAAFAALKLGGRLFVCGASAQAKAVQKDLAALFGAAETVALKHRQRLVVAEKSVRPGRGCVLAFGSRCAGAGAGVLARGGFWRYDAGGIRRCGGLEGGGQGGVLVAVRAG